MTREFRQRVEMIASEYHLAQSAEDMHIERIAQESELDWVVDQIPLNSKVLELGVGDGVTMRRLCEKYEYEVVEGSRELVDEASNFARKSGYNFAVHHAWFEEFRPESKYEFIFASHVLEHVEDPVELLKRIRNWLTPGGKLLVIVPNAESIHRRLGLQLGLQKSLDELSKRDEAVGHLRVYSLDAVTADLSAGGFRVDVLRGFFVKPFSNSQLQTFSDDVIRGLCAISSGVDARLCANLCIIASPEQN